MRAASRPHARRDCRSRPATERRHGCLRPRGRARRAADRTTARGPRRRRVPAAARRARLRRRRRDDRRGRRGARAERDPRCSCRRRDRRPRLDEDLARWESPALSVDQTDLLGPVGARTTGDTKATAHRRPFYIELLAYLALHPDGVPGRDVADAFALRPERVRVDMSHLRRWLGTNPRTGNPYLPKAEPARHADSPALYRLDGVAVRPRPVPPSPHARTEPRRRRHRRSDRGAPTGQR